MLRMTKKQKIVLYTILILIGAVCVFPFLWLVSASFKPEVQIFAFPPKLIPDRVVFSNYPAAFDQTALGNWLFNSLYITVIVVVVGSFTASMSGFAFAKMKFPGSSLLFLLPLCAMMVPNEVIIVPLFKVWGALNLVNTHVPLILVNIVGVGGMYGVFLFRQFYLAIPTELCEAAKLDGCTPFGTYWRIMLPISQSTIMTLAIYNFMNTWNDFLDPLIYLNTTEKYTIALGLNLYKDMTGTLWGALMAACVLATLPLIIMFFFAQDKFIESVAVSGMKN